MTSLFASIVSDRYLPYKIIPSLGQNFNNLKILPNIFFELGETGMRLLIIGSNGQLGWELCRLASHFKFECVELDLPDFDITNPNHIKHNIEGSSKSIVVNSAAYTAVDKAETDKDTAFAVNAVGPRLIAEVCRKKNLPLIQISTDYVFSGEKQTDYTENDLVCPLGVYGKSKAEGEQAVRELLPEHLIIRTAWLYGVHGHNFVKTMLRLGKEKEVLRVVSDQIGCPTDALDLAEAILLTCSVIRDKGSAPWGTYHFCGAGKTSWHGFAEKILEFAKDRIALKANRVEPISTQEYPTPAVRPKRSVLDCSKIEEAFAIRRREWSESLKDMILRLNLPGEAVLEKL
jgi:dTDP-4-dehydrorhamnose reductase